MTGTRKRAGIQPTPYGTAPLRLQGGSGTPAAHSPQAPMATNAPPASNTTPAQRSLAAEPRKSRAKAVPASDGTPYRHGLRRDSQVTAPFKHPTLAPQGGPATTTNAGGQPKGTDPGTQPKPA